MTIEKVRMQKEIHFRKERLERQKMGEEFVTETIYLNYAVPADVEKMLRTGGTGAVQLAAGGGRGFLSEFGNITQVPWNNALIIRDTKENVASIAKIVKEQDRKPTQIQIDCKIVQATQILRRKSAYSGV